MKKCFIPKKSVLAVALAMGTMSLALAQAEAPQKGELEKITITGSNIKRVNLETASPVQIITREELVRGGATSLNEVLRTISSNVGGIDENRTSGFSAGGSIPIGAVERIEVLKDGASAIYGSEAMAGVVNIILRNSFEGLVVDGSIGRSEYGDGQ